MNQHFNSMPGVEGYLDAQKCIQALFPGDTPGISLRLFRKLQAQGYIPYLKLGRRTLFAPSEVKAALEKRCKRKAVAV
jgi:hypothetical protein